LASASPVPAERVWALPAPKAERPARITFVRDTGPSAQDADVTVWVDGQKAAVLRPAETVSFNVEPGDRQVSSDHSWNLLKHHKPTVIDNRAEPGQHLVYRVGFENMAGSLRLVMHRDLMATK
jgi:hypothetical protein